MPNHGKTIQDLWGKIPQRLITFRGGPSLRHWAAPCDMPAPIGKQVPRVGNPGSTNSQSLMRMWDPISHFKED
eukprot:1299230-Karenia_brevis.AAC.1